MTLRPVFSFPRFPPFRPNVSQTFRWPVVEECGADEPPTRSLFPNVRLLYQSCPSLSSGQEYFSPSLSLSRPAQNTSPTSLIRASRPNVQRIQVRSSPQSSLSFLSTTHTAEFSLPVCDIVTTTPLDRDPKIVRTHPGPVTREAVLTNTRRFSRTNGSTS